MNWTTVFRDVDALILSRAQLASRGATGQALAAAVAAGALIRLRRGIYALPGTSDAVVEAVRIGGRVACVSALRAAGVWVFESSSSHVHLTHGSSRLRSPASRHTKLTARNRDGCRLHWVGLADPERALPHSVSPLDAMIQATRCQATPHAIASIDSALHRGFIRAADLTALFAALPARYSSLHPRVDGRCESGLESILRLLLVDGCIPFDLQVRVRGVGRVDFVVGGRVVVEVDGLEFHGAPTAARDYDRDLRLVALGFVVIRLNYRQVLFEQDRVLAAVRSALASTEAANRR